MIECARMCIVYIYTNMYNEMIYCHGSGSDAVNDNSNIKILTALAPPTKNAPYTQYSQY